MAASDAFYNELAIEVNDLLEEFGAEFTIKAPGVYDKNTLTVGEPTSRTAFGVVSSSEFGSNIATQIYAISQLSSNQYSKSVLILTASTNPKPQEKVVVDGKEYELAKARPVRPAEVTVVYILDLMA